MRYYGFVMNTSTEEIGKNATVRWKNYDYDTVLGAVNAYFYQAIKNDIGFHCYRETENGVYAVFFYDENKFSVDSAFAEISEILSTAFSIHKIKEAPYEITGGDFYDCINEARRRGYGAAGRGMKLIDMAKLNVFHVLKDNSRTHNNLAIQLAYL